MQHALTDRCGVWTDQRHTRPCLLHCPWKTTSALPWMLLVTASVPSRSEHRHCAVAVACRQRATLMRLAQVEVLVAARVRGLRLQRLHLLLRLTLRRQPPHQRHCHRTALQTWPQHSPQAGFDLALTRRAIARRAVPSNLPSRRHAHLVDSFLLKAPCTPLTLL